MDSIIVRCKMCKHEMKFSAAKAGKRAKCSKCDAIVLVQPSEAPKKDDDTPPPAPEPAAPAPAADPFDDDGPANYGVFTDPELEERRKAMEAEEEAKRTQRKKRDKLPSVTRKVKAIPDKEAWEKVRQGMLFVHIGVWIWLGCHLLQGTYVLLGSIDLPEYAVLIARNLEVRNNAPFPEAGQAWDMDDLDIYLGMIGGKSFAGLARTFLTISSVLFFVQALFWGVGYIFCLWVPRRYGMFGQLIVLFLLAMFNFLFMFIFKLLPVLGAHGYVMIPLLVPEIVLTEYNMERMVPINILWSNWPFLENSGNMIIKTLLYLEPTFLSIFVWSAGVAIKDDQVADNGWGRVQMSLGTFFILIVYHMMSLCGASPVLVMFLRVVYALWFFFLIIFMLQFAMMLLKFRAVLYDKINPKNELEEEAPKKKKKKG